MRGLRPPLALLPNKNALAGILVRSLVTGARGAWRYGTPYPALPYS